MSRLEKLEQLATAVIALEDHMDNTPYSRPMTNYTREEFLAECDKYRKNLHVLEEEYRIALSEVRNSTKVPTHEL